MATTKWNTPVLLHFEQHLVFTGFNFFFSVSLIGGSSSSLGQPTTFSLEDDVIFFFLLKKSANFSLPGWFEMRTGTHTHSKGITFSFYEFHLARRA